MCRYHGNILLKCTWDISQDGDIRPLTLLLSPTHNFTKDTRDTKTVADVNDSSPQKFGIFNRLGL